MEKIKGVIISQEEFERFKKLDEDFKKVADDNIEFFKEKIRELKKGNLVKVLWVYDQHAAEIAKCDFSDEHLTSFLERDIADIQAKFNQGSYNREEMVEKYKRKEKARVPKMFGGMFFSDIFLLTLGVCVVLILALLYFCN